LKLDILGLNSLDIIDKTIKYIKQYEDKDIDLLKIDVEGAEWSVFKGLNSKMETITFEWTLATIQEHIKQLNYLAKIGYTKVAPQFIEHHCQEPQGWFDINLFDLDKWHRTYAHYWENGDWKRSGLRPTADVGMLWIK
jgi:hypothetical protein